MIDIVIIAVLLCIVGSILYYLSRAKKRGETCIGCPYSRQCGSKSCSCEGSGREGGGSCSKNG